MGAPGSGIDAAADTLTVTDLPTWVATPESAASIDNRAAKLRSAIAMRMVGSPAVRDAGLSLAQEAANAVREAADVDAAAAFVIDLSGVPADCARGLIGYFVYGEPPAGSVVSSILKVFTSVPSATLTGRPSEYRNTGIEMLNVKGKQCFTVKHC